VVVVMVMVLVVVVVVVASVSEWESIERHVNAPAKRHIPVLCVSSIRILNSDRLPRRCAVVGVLSHCEVNRPCDGVDRTLAMPCGCECECNWSSVTVKLTDPATVLTGH
jgi:hypothetical protein